MAFADGECAKMNCAPDSVDERMSRLERGLLGVHAEVRATHMHARARVSSSYEPVNTIKIALATACFLLLVTSTSLFFLWLFQSMDMEDARVGDMLALVERRIDLDGLAVLGNVVREPY